MGVRRHLGLGPVGVGVARADQPQTRPRARRRGRRSRPAPVAACRPAACGRPARRDRVGDAWRSSNCVASQRLRLHAHLLGKPAAGDAIVACHRSGRRNPTSTRAGERPPPRWGSVSGVTGRARASGSPTIASASAASTLIRALRAEILHHRPSALGERPEEREGHLRGAGCAGRPPRPGSARPARARGCRASTRSKSTASSAGQRGEYGRARRSTSASPSSASLQTPSRRATETVCSPWVKTAASTFQVSNGKATVGAPPHRRPPRASCPRSLTQ